MTNTLLGILICLAAVGVTALLMAINNNKKTGRALQVPFPLISALALAAGIALLTFFRTEVMGLFSRTGFLRGIYTAVFDPSGFFFGCEILFWNILIIWLFLLLKLLLRPLFSGILGNRTASRWYEAGQEGKRFFLKDSAVNLRKLMGILTVILGFCTAAVCFVSRLSGQNGNFWLYLYPGAVWTIISEIYWFLAGWTREEYGNRVGGEDPVFRQHSNYSLLRQIFEELFPEPLLSSRSGKVYDDKSGTTDLLAQMAESDDKTERLAADYFLNLPDRKRGAFDMDMVKASTGLLRGQSTIVFDPFYRDLNDYLTLPMMDALLSGRKILVICGRQAIVGDVLEWVEGLMLDYCRTDRLWRTGLLDGKTELDVGVLAFSNLYDVDIVNGSNEFFDQVGFILLVEPTRMLTTAQAGLGIIVGKLNQTVKPTFCAVDREADGLVDLLSHLFLQNVTSVVASPPIRALYTAMGWDASGDYHRQSLFQHETHYLGNGVELAATALKYQVPEVSWYSEEKAPVRDLRWIAQQYYQQISKYAGIPNRQAALDEMIRFIPNPLNSEVTESAFIIVEDECCNLFATVRAYLSRASRNLFVNVLSENYLLRDYMRSNWRLFMNDAKAIPIITPHYAKTERNTVLRLVIMMSGEAVREEYIRHELQMLGYKDDNIYDKISTLIAKYLGTAHTVITVSNRREYTVEDMPVPVQYYEIPRKKFDVEFASTLKTGFFVVEDEKLESEHIDARMFQHITQLVMPGQQIIHGGKVYKVHKVSTDVGCILHRAADLYMSRLYYRQLRTYSLERVTEIISRRTVGDMEVTVENMDFYVTSLGYVEMKKAYDLNTAMMVDLSQDPSIKSGAYRRDYTTKSVLKLKFSGMNEKIRYTFSLILGEIFRTIFPYSWHFLAVLCDKSLVPEGMLRKMTYDVMGDYDREAIYILEDSVMDLGLLEAVENNLTRLLEIMADYLNWNSEYTEDQTEDPETQTVDLPAGKGKKGKGFFERLFGRRKKKAPADQTKGEDSGEEKEEEKPEAEKQGTEEPEDQKNAKKSGKEEPDAGQDSADSGTGHGDDDPAAGSVGFDYGKTCFLKFGGRKIDPSIAVDAAREYLNSHGYGDNSLSQARNPSGGSTSELDGSIVCDFCGLRMTGVMYDRLADGRIRCGRCSATAITSLKQFEDLLQDAMTIMEESYHIAFKTGVTVRMVDADTLGRVSNAVFRPTAGFDRRVVGLAVFTTEGKYEMYVENGGPRLATLSTMVHELTHIWQYQNWDRKAIIRKYGKQNRDLVYEGMAVWAEIQTLYILGEYAHAYDREQGIRAGSDVYSVGARKYLEKYRVDRNGSIRKKTPFDIFPPL